MKHMDDLAYVAFTTVAILQALGTTSTIHGIFDKFYMWHIGYKILQNASGVQSITKKLCTLQFQSHLYEIVYVKGYDKFVYSASSSDL